MKRRKKQLTVTLHVLAWLLVFFLPNLLFDMPQGPISEAKKLFHFVLVFLFFYLNYFLFVPLLLLRKKQLWFAVVVLFSLVFSYYTNDFVMQQVRQKNSIYLKNKEQREQMYSKIPQAQHKMWQQRHRTGENAGTAVIVLISFLLSTIILETHEWYKKDEEKRGMEKERLVSELSLLKSQVNPHFLFNSLNGIYALSIKKSDKTPEAILQLSDLLRHMLYDAEKEKIELDKEITYLKNYIALQKLRLPADAVVSFETEGNTEHIAVAPLLFIPFVENAFKHGTGAEKPVIEVKLKADKYALRFTVVNTISQAKSKDKASGIGLSNVKKRLSLLYPGKYNLEISNEKNFYHVLLEIKWV